MESKSRSPFDYDNEKAALVKKSNSLENNLDLELDNIKEYVQEYGKNIAIIGGSLLATYLLVRILTNSSKSSTVKYNPPAQAQPIVHVVKEKDGNPIAKQIKSSIALFLMSIAKQKLMDYLNQNLAKSE